jgi:hypothetical protein
MTLAALSRVLAEQVVSAGGVYRPRPLPTRTGNSRGRERCCSETLGSTSRSGVTADVHHRLKPDPALCGAPFRVGVAHGV